MSQVVEQHEFKKKHFSRPTWCSFCEKFIWGLGKQGYACKKCSYPCHPKCQIPSLMKTSCPGAHPENQEQDNRPQHAQPGQNISSNPIHEPNQPSPKPMIKTESLLRFTAGKKEEYPGNIEDYYDMREQIGKGAFSVVKKAICREDGQVYAVKVINKANQDLSRLTVEMEILQSVKHSNIIQLKEIYEKESTLYIITELVTGGELFDRIVKKGHYTEKDAAAVIRKLCEAIDYLHNKGIVHRDLKPENLLLKSEDDDTEIKVADFGLSKIVGADNMMQSACGTPAYVAPEILSSAPYTKAVDMWSIGVITYILLCGFPPFYHQHIPILFKAILKADFSYPEEYWSNISDDAIDFIDNLLVRDPDLRMTAKQALSHRWLKNPNRETALNVPGKLQSYNSSYKESFQAFGPTSFDEE